MRSVAVRRVPTILIILFALIGIAASVAIGRAIGAGMGEASTGDASFRSAAALPTRA